MDKINNNFGLPNNSLSYLKLSDKQSLLNEFVKTDHFLRKNFKNYLITEAPELIEPNMKLQFINYGDTELVYVLYSDNKQYAVLVGQPMTEFGSIKEEFNNLKYLAQDNPDFIVKPLHYFTNGERELFIAPYIYKARCIASTNKWGIYVPEPNYHFEEFTDEQRFIVNSSMIALLIKTYNEEKELGICSCKLGGGDFILDRNWTNMKLSRENILNNMKIVAARELIYLSLEDYIDLIKREFVKITYYENEKYRNQTILINQKGRVPMDKEEIEEGISLGLKLRKR